MDEIPPKKRRRRRKVDPRRVLQDIAGDPDASAALRYRAASRLLAAEQREKAAADRPGPAPATDDDPITRRALQIAAQRATRRLN